jgi:hypothetical protein
MKLTKFFSIQCGRSSPKQVFEEALFRSIGGFCRQEELSQHLIQVITEIIKPSDYIP